MPTARDIVRFLRGLIFLILLTPCFSFSAEEVRPPAGEFPYAGQGPFVVGPARTLAAPAFSAGFMAGALLCLPISLIQNPKAGTQGPNGKEASIVCGKGLGTLVGWPVYTAGGFPFFLIKKLFWDAPRAVMGR